MSSPFPITGSNVKQGNYLISSTRDCISEMLSASRLALQGVGMYAMFWFLYSPQMLHSTKLIDISRVKVVSETTNQNQHLWFSCQKERGRLLLSSEKGLSRWRQGKALNAGWALTLVGFLHAACKDQWEEGCGARHSFKMVWVWQNREEGLMISSHRVAFHFLYVCCALLTYQCFCWRVSSKSFCLSLGIEKTKTKPFTSWLPHHFTVSLFTL